MLSFMGNKIKNSLLAISLILIPMWVVFVINQGFVTQYFVDLFGIHPRRIGFSEFLGIMFSWLIHGDLKHIMNNSIGLFGILIFVGLFEQKYIKLLIVLVATSGFSTWVLGSSNSVHVGASGLLFALFGYILAAAFTGRKWIYFVPIIGAFSYYGFSYYGGFLNGLIVKEEVSFAAHFGGLLSGIACGIYFERNNNVKKIKRSFKERWSDFKWDLNYKIKNLKK